MSKIFLLTSKTIDKKKPHFQHVVVVKDEDVKSLSKDYDLEPLPKHLLKKGSE